MFTQSEYVAVQMNRDARDRAYQEAETLRKLRNAGLLNPGKIERAFCFGAGCLGRMLVSVGQKLVRVGSTASQGSPSLGSARMA